MPMPTSTPMLAPAVTASTRTRHRSRRQPRGEYAPGTRAADVARLLDPTYTGSLPRARARTSFDSAIASFGSASFENASFDDTIFDDTDDDDMETSTRHRAHHRARSAPAGRTPQVRAYVDADGELHDPDYRVFPVFPAPARARRHTVGGRVPGPARSAGVGARRAFGDEEERDDDEDEDEGEDEDGRGEGAPFCRAGFCPRGPPRPANMRSSTSLHSAVSYMYHDEASIVSAPTVPVSLAGTYDELEEIHLSECEGAEFGALGVRDDGGAEDVDDCSSSSKWSFFRRMMCTQDPDTNPSSHLTSATLAHSASSRDHGHGHTHSRSRSRSGSGSGSRSLLQRVLRSRSASTSTSASVSTSFGTSPPDPDCALYAISAPDAEKSDAEVVVHECYGSLCGGQDAEDAPAAALPGAEAESASRREEAGLRRRLRAAHLRWRTKAWRAKKRLLASLPLPLPGRPQEPAAAFSLPAR